MTIIHVSSSLGGGGAQQMILQLAKLSNPEIKTIIFSISHVDTLLNKFSSNNIDVHFLNITSFRNSSLIHAVKKLHSIVKDLNAPVFHCHQFHGILLGVIYNSFYSKIPIIATLHTNKVASYLRRLLLFLTKPFRKKDIIFSINSAKWYLKNDEIIPNGVDFEKLKIETKRSYDKSNEFQFLFLGRLNTPKNPLYLIKAVKLLLKEGIGKFKIIIVGDGDMKPELTDQISSNQLENHFNLMGYKDDIRPYLSKSHCLILPSLWEGMPVAIIESAAAKLPVISTPVGSIPDFLNSSNSYISNINDFHISMIEVMKDYNTAIKKSEKLYNELESSFNIINVYNRHLQVYKSVVKNNIEN